MGFDCLPANEQESHKKGQVSADSGLSRASFVFYVSLGRASSILSAEFRVLGSMAWDVGS